MGKWKREDRDKDKDTEDGKEEDTTDFYLFDEKTTTTDHLKNNLF